ncbi:VOC family protein [Specibacter sp. AOP5-B1-6]|uniref:VOC family protein n=1 Tax=Specibacter sp. AOP5-B1-6 TaxID=3457653 RepID=UPI00402B522C
MATRLNPYLNFRDNARDAMEFYHGVFGGTLELSTFGDFQASQDPVEKDLIMHGMLTGDNDVVLMGADLPASMALTDNSSVSLSGDEEAVLRGWWDKLADGATVAEPLAKAPWGDTFGMLTDKFGVPWLVNIAGTPQA